MTTPNSRPATRNRTSMSAGEGLAARLDDDPRSLLTTSNPKTAKGEGSGYLTAIMHLAPAMASGVVNVCGHASEGCKAACLNTAGRGGIGLDADGLNTVQVARVQRTRLWRRDRAGFFRRLTEEIARHERRAKRHGLKSAVRLNGTSDLPWERLTHPDTELSLPAMFPDSVFYDYTKFPINLRRPSESYHLTYSLSDDPRSDERARAALKLGINVAAVFATPKGADLPDTYNLDGETFAVIDGDSTDLRFLDPVGCIVGLRAKGRAKGSATGFVRAAS